ncbi:hypothetical protein KL905_004292 [Ogataea polymorpha]|uniref:Uncharacterized protein n=1 Tax=Ogataea polymorpha TaxID=460523 RepID=A0A1B7SHB7_9ASCO|nr:uncharacterized protein OGAPODRAFT_16624 [Ogataea polymorpha]KAG7897973.1 hypothetical protein KL935_004526 [Ogataea polymorpha]KAG7900599.1 hypothetical protein KL907_004717 [Ogataea polymorpha]KAG7906138.1 hypothetical protein KL906_004591 [Ogataea polymorpha]KAG7917272.1 hypothetical protein KL905_004292 [Ogataea polymorpha]KAG7925061.1 hypothetical protein KL925_004903 [Ogataea polymorpha]
MRKDDRLRFNLFFTDLVKVLKEIDTHEVLSIQLPKNDKFFENDPKQITSNFLNFLDLTGNDFTKDVSIEDKFDSAEYESIYQIYHDIKIASLIAYSSKNSEADHVQIDRFYHIAVELLLKESLRLDSTVVLQERETRRSFRNEIKQKANKQEIENEDDIRTSLRKAIVRDFELITTSYFNKSGDALLLTAANGVPFFSSLNKRISELDDRKPNLDDDVPVETLTVVPSLLGSKSENLSQLCQTPINQQALPTEILSQSFHPNWYNIPVSQWIKHGFNDDAFSFAPMYDESRSIISNEWKGLIWLQHYGLKRVLEIKKQLEKEQNEENEVDAGKSPAITCATNGAGKLQVAMEQETIKAEPAIVDASIPADQVEHDQTQNGIDEASEEDIELDSGPIDLEKIIQWNAGNVIDEDEQQAVNDNCAQKTITKLLLELNQLRRERFRGGAAGKREIFKPSKIETIRFNQLRRMITGIIKHKNVQPRSLEIEPSSKIPVLQHNYNGSLPSSMMSDAHNSQAVQMATYNRPMKRRR